MSLAATRRCSSSSRSGDHIAYEQEVMWPLVQGAVRHDDLVRLGDKLEAAKKIAPTRPHPDTPPSPGVSKTMGMATAWWTTFAKTPCRAGGHRQPARSANH